MSENKQRRSGLGRGLGALIVSTDPAAAEASGAAGESPAGVRLVRAAEVEPNPRQPRTRFEEEALEELAISIRQHGIIQPLIVTANPQRPDHYWVVAGERRLRAAQRAGIEQVPVIVREASPQELVELALIENLQRADLNPLEEAGAYASLMEEFGLTQAEVADRVGKSRPAVANTVRLLQLPGPVQSALADGVLTAGHARALLSLPDAQQMEAAMAEIVRKDMNVRQAEALVKRLVDAASAPTAPVLPENPQIKAQLARMEESFRAALGTRVSLNRNADGSGRLVVHFFSDDDLESIYRIIAGSEAATE